LSWTSTVPSCRPAHRRCGVALSADGSDSLRDGQLGPVRSPSARLPGTLKAAVVRSCGFALFLGACATIANTPQQELAYARWAKCSAPYVSLEQVDLDGRITFKISNGGAGNRSGNASPRLAAQGRRFPSPWASTLPVAHERPTRQLLRAALGFAGLPRPTYDCSLWALRTWLDSWAGIGRAAVGMTRP
jgi:hypothetical protein